MGFLHISDIYGCGPDRGIILSYIDDVSRLWVDIEEKCVKFSVVVWAKRDDVIVTIALQFRNRLHVGTDNQWRPAC